MAQNKRQDLIQGPIISTLLFFAVPTLISNVLQSLNGSINTIWVGRFLGETALAATANAFIIMFLLFSFIFGFGMAATVMVGQNFGQYNLNGARRAFGSAIGFCVVLSLIIAVLGWFYSPEILSVMGTPPAAYILAQDYLRVIFIAMPGNMIFVMLIMGLRGSGDSMTPLWFMIVNVILDVIFNPLLIMGIGPFPALGISGSAWATAVSTYGSLFALVFYLYWRDLPLRLRGAEWRFLIPSPALLRIIFLKGFPMSLQMLVMSSASMIMVSLVNREGVNIAAAYNVSQQLWTYVQMPAMAVGAAVSAMAAQNIGAGLWNRVNKITEVGGIITVVFTGVLIGLLFLFDRSVMAVFLGPESAAIADARHIQLLASWSFIFFGVSMVIYSTMRANGVVIVPLILLFVSLYPVRLGFYYFAYPYLRADAIWLSFPVGAFFGLILALLYYCFGHWRKTALVEVLNHEDAREKTETGSEPTGRLKPNS